MKKTITLAILLCSALLFSCTKEAPVQQDDFAVNAALDQKLFDNVLTMSHEQLTQLAQQKTAVVNQIKAHHPGITFKDVYPNSKATMTFAGRLDCQGAFNVARTNCNIAYLATCFESVVEGGIIGMLLPPVGAVVGGSGVVKATYAYAVCMHNANDALNACK